MFDIDATASLSPRNISPTNTAYGSPQMDGNTTSKIPKISSPPSSYSHSPPLAPISFFDSNRVHCLWAGCYLSFPTEHEAYNHVCDEHIPELMQLPVCLWQPSLHNTTSPCGFKFKLGNSSSSSLFFPLLNIAALSSSSSSPSLNIGKLGKREHQKVKQHLLIHLSPNLLTLPCPVKDCPRLFRHAKAVKKHCVEEHTIETFQIQRQDHESVVLNVCTSPLKNGSSTEECGGEI